jgi:hypothetical protein
MFVLCTHCQFLVTVDGASGAPPARCPRCRGLVVPVPAGKPAVSDDLSAAMAELAPPAVVASARRKATAARDDAPQGGGAASNGHASANAKTRLPWNPPAAQPTAVAPATTTAAARGSDAATPDATAMAAVAADDATAVDTVTTSPAAAIVGGAAPDALAGLPAADALPHPDAAVGDPGAENDIDGDPAGQTTQSASVRAAAAEPGEGPSAAVAPALDDATRLASEEAPATSTPAAASAATPARAPRNPMPAWLRKPRFAFARSEWFRRWRAPAAIAALTVLLAVQMLLADRAQLAADAQWRPWMQAACGVLGCDLPPWRQPDAFRLIERNVAADPGRPGVLKVHARFRNDARWSQPWPAIALTLSDANGRTLGTRVFMPGEYLATGTTQNGIASGQLATVSIDVVEPAPGVVAFTFDFQ